MHDFTKLEKYLDSVCARGYAPCCDMAIYRDHRCVFRYMTGVTHRNGTVPVSDQTLYYLYSCSKPITVTAGMQLVENGKLSLDAPVWRYLPAYRDAYVIEDGKKISVGEDMLVRHLFTMSAGLNYELNRPEVQALLAQNPDADTRSIVNTFVEQPLDFRPGKRFQYSLCHDVLGAVIEVASGENFGEYLERHIFAPLGMTRTYFATPGIVPEQMAGQYRYWGTQMDMDEVTGNGNSFVFSKNYQSGGAGLISCTADYALFADAMACGGAGREMQQILRAETIDLMRTEQLSALTEQPESFSCAAGPGYGYGLGVRTLISKADGQRSNLGEFGWDGADGAYIMIDPVEKLSIVYTQHVQNWTEELEYHAPLRDMTYEILGL